MTKEYDIIGDIHGHADELVKLLEHMDYHKTETGYQHPNRKVIFLGDFIDRGEHLGQHRQLLKIVMDMVQNGHALSVMGNHEFNALAFHTMHNGEYLRARTPKNVKQHQAFLNEFENEPELKQDILDFFYTLPMWLELDGLRVVHACWDVDQISRLSKESPKGYLSQDLLIKASTPETPEYYAIETLLKGCEVELPPGISFKDKDGHERQAVRVQWWNQKATTLGEMALPMGVDIADAADLDRPDNIPYYPSEAAPCFIGHYWLNGTPAPLSDNVACLDYSIAKQGKLVAYRFSGESKLSESNFAFVS